MSLWCHCLNQNIIFGAILVQMMTPKRHCEINWHLTILKHRPENLWNYPLITYLRWPNNIWTKFGNSGHCVQAASTASSVVLCPLYLQLVCWRSVRKKAPKIVWSQYLASGEKRLTCCYLTSFYLFIFATVAYDLRNDKLSQRVNCDSRNCHSKLI